MGLVHEPASTDTVTARARRVDDRGVKPLHPAMQCHVVHLDAAFGEEFSRSRYDNPNRRYHRTANLIPSRGEPKPSERGQQLGGVRDMTTTFHRHTLAAGTICQRNKASAIAVPISAIDHLRRASSEK